MNAIADNKQTVADFLKALPSDTEFALDMLSDDTIWLVMGDTSVNKMSGPKTKDEIADTYRNIGALMSGLEFVVNSMTAEENRVAAEVETFAQLINGKEYHNTYTFHFVLDAGSIIGIREYSDTNYAETILADVADSM
jgi:ketosteroid isomerase-like protein